MLTLGICMLVGVSRLEAAVAEDRGAPSNANALTLAAALDQLALVRAPMLCSLHFATS